MNEEEYTFYLVRTMLKLLQLLFKTLKANTLEEFIIKVMNFPLAELLVDIEMAYAMKPSLPAIRDGLLEHKKSITTKDRTMFDMFELVQHGDLAITNKMIDFVEYLIRITD